MCKEYLNLFACLSRGTSREEFNILSCALSSMLFGMDKRIMHIHNFIHLNLFVCAKPKCYALSKKEIYIVACE